LFMGKVRFALFLMVVYPAGGFLKNS